MASRIMLELEPEEKDRELCIEFYLEAFRDYIASKVDYRDLLFYEHFDYDLRGKFRQLRQRESNKYVVSEMIDAILNMKGVPGRFTQLVEGEFSTTENTKVLSILTGQKLPLNQEESKARLKQLNRKEVCDRLDVMTITPFLVQKSVITTTDQETIRNTAQRESRFDAAIDLLQIIANRDEKWFVKFMMALIDSGQIELARFVDEDLCTNIIQEREKKVKENRGHEDLSLNTEIGIANELGCNYGSLVSNVGSVSSVRLSCIGEEQLVPREYDFGDDGQTDETIPKTVDDSTPELNDYCNRLGELEASNVKMKSQIEILAKIIVKALTPDRAQLKLLQTLEKTISGDHHTNHSDGEELMTACTNLGSDLRDQDVDIVKVEEGSILMTLRCPTLSALKKITVYFANRIHETRLAEVEKALSKYVESPVKLTMNIVIETLYSALKQIEKDAHAKSVVLTLQCSGAEGVRNAFDFFGNGSSNNSLNSLSEALSRYVGERVELHAAIDVDQLNTDMKELEELPKEVGENEDEGFGDVNTMASDCEEDFVDNEYTLRSFQTELVQYAIMGRNTIICSETGTGKTWVALEIIKKHFEEATNVTRKVAFMARTSMLLEQQSDRFKRYLPMQKTKVITGDDEDSKQLNMFMDMNDIICFTPQILVNNLDVKAVKSLSEFSLLILDECHHTRGDEPYNRLMRSYIVEKSQNVVGLPQVVGLTASIGVGKSRTEDEAVDYILRVMACLDVRILSTVERNIAELRRYTHMPLEETIPLEKLDHDLCRDVLLIAKEETEDLLYDFGFTPDLIDLICERQPPEKDLEAYNKWTVVLFKWAQLKVDDHGMSRNICACARYLNTYNSALEINKLLGSKDVIKYLTGKHDDDVMHKEKHTGVEITLFKKFLYVEKKLRNKGEVTENPNVRTLSNTLKTMLDEKGEDSRAFVIVKARATCRALAEFLDHDLLSSGYKTSPLYGKENRGGDYGMSESVQTDILEKFHEGFYKVLVCTSVGYEGIDVPQCNIVLSYEYSGDEITKIQMKGRARKQDATITLMADEKMMEQDRINAYKAAMMYRALKRIKCLQPKFVETKVRNFQSEEMSKYRFKVETEGYKKGRQSEEDHDILCGRCNVFACFISDVRRMGSNYVVIDKDITAKIERKEHKRPKIYDGLHKKYKMYCKKCGLDWGIIGIRKGLDYCILKIENMKFRNHRTKGIQVYKKWLDQPYRVPEMTPEDGLRLLHN